MSNRSNLFFLTAICFIWLANPISEVSAEELKVTNLTFTIQENDIAIIHYDLEDGGRNRRYNVSLSLKQLTDPTLNYTPSAVIGDIGKGRFEGKNNKIVWSMMHEDPDDFTLNPFIDNYYFSIDARRRGRAGWWFFFTIIGGAATYYFTSY